MQRRVGRRATRTTEALVPGYFDDGNIELYYPHPDDFDRRLTSAYCVYYGDEPG